MTLLISPYPRSLRSLVSSPSSQVTDTQHAEEQYDNADSTKSIDAFVSVEELRNQPEPADATK
ncbi:hypothetical protein Tco_0334213, partial [Tanacetum coccineum]